MGQSVSQVKANAAHNSHEEALLAGDILDPFMRISEQNLTLFLQEIPKRENEIPIRTILRHVNMIRCNVSKDGSQLKEIIHGTLGDAISSNFLSIITHQVAIGLDIVLSNASATRESEYNGFTVAVGALGGFFRIDYLLYCYTFKSQSVVKLTKNIVCASIVISAIDTEKLDKNTVNVIIQMSFPDASVDELRVIQRDIYEMLGWEDRLKESFFKAQAPLKSLEWKKRNVYGKLSGGADEEEDDAKDDK